MKRENNRGNGRRLSRKQVLATLGLLVTSIIWGSGFVVMKRSVEDAGPLYLLAWRFTVAAACLLVFFFPELRRLRKSDLRPGVIIGFWLFVSYLTQTYGIKYTTASNNAFITAFYVILVPFIHPLLNRGGGRLRGRHLAAAFTAIFGIGLLSLDSTFTIRLGDGLTFLCSICYAVHMVLLGRCAPDHRPIILTMLQMAVCAALSWIAAPIFEGRPPWESLTPSFAAGILYLGIFSTMVCFLLQTWGQRYLPPQAASILLSMECVFGAAFSIFFLDDPFTVR
ncbi:MAG: DMT family transporter, partial [Peptococcaceae bacterium]|nr:DMT family transporter [Peptococcaceae bacterium]